jgi:hypothetical protein
MTEGICAECLWYHEESSPGMTRWYGFCKKHDKRIDDDSPACKSLRAWHIPEHVSLFNKESMLFPVS